MIIFKSNLKKKFFLYPLIFLLIAFSNFPLLKLFASQDNKEQKISVEFLDQLPSNDYIIGPGDSLNIIISRDLKISSEVEVDGEGTIYLPKLQRVFVDGLTINELNTLLNESYKEFIKFPNVETIVISYRPIRVFVEGEVVNPGMQILEGSLSLREDPDLSAPINYSSKKSFFFPTVFDAIRSSGGITQFSDLKTVKIIRKDNISNGSGRISTTLNFEDLLLFGDNSQNIRIYDSDIIKVQRNTKTNQKLLTKAILSQLNPKFIRVFVSGRVNRPGEQKVSRASVLSDAIDMAGGAKTLKGKVTFIRFQSDGSIDKRKIRYTTKNRGKFANPNLRDGDLIIVGESLLTKTNEVISEFTSPFVGIFSTYGLIKAITDN